MDTTETTTTTTYKDKDKGKNRTTKTKEKDRNRDKDTGRGANKGDISFPLARGFNLTWPAEVWNTDFFLFSILWKFSPGAPVAGALQ
jgi:hypothetical protein